MYQVPRVWSLEFGVEVAEINLILTLGTLVTPNSSSLLLDCENRNSLSKNTDDEKEEAAIWGIFLELSVKPAFWLYFCGIELVP